MILGEKIDVQKGIVMNEYKNKVYGEFKRSFLTVRFWMPS